jgi:hypothetical protein
MSGNPGQRAGSMAEGDGRSRPEATPTQGAILTAASAGDGSTAGTREARGSRSSASSAGVSSTVAGLAAHVA